MPPPAGGGARPRTVCTGRFFVLYGPATDGHMVARLRDRAHIDVLSTASARAYSGSLAAGARLRGMHGAPTARLVASLLAASGARSYVAQTPGPGAAASHVFCLSVECEPLTVELVVPVAAAAFQPFMRAAFEELFSGVNAWQAAAFALAEQDVAEDDGGSGSGDSNENENENEDDAVVGDVGVELYGFDKRVLDRCEDVLVEQAAAIRSGLSVPLPCLGTNAFAYAHLPSLHRQRLLAEAEKCRKNKVEADARAAERKRKREQAAAEAAAAAATVGFVAHEVATHLPSLPAPSTRKRERKFDDVSDDSDEQPAVREIQAQAPTQSQAQSQSQSQAQAQTQSQGPAQTQSQARTQASAGAASKKKKKKKLAKVI